MKCGIVGPGRTRNGLAPFLANFLEQAGGAVVAAAGRDLERTRRATAVLGERLGHDVRAFESVEAMVADADLDALIIAAPVAVHLKSLRAALAARLHVLCEKPLVHEDALGEVPALIEGFREAGLVLVENCQWPEMLGAFDRLWPGCRSGAVAGFGLGLAPAGRGREMVEDSLSHFVSLAQALRPIGPDTVVSGVRFVGRTDEAECLELRAEFRDPGFEPLAGRLELVRVPVQPRPAWLSIADRRAARAVRLPDYAISLEAPDGRSVPVEDPLGRLVYRFARLATSADRDRIRSEADDIRERQRLYGEILQRWSRQ